VEADEEEIWERFTERAAHCEFDGNVSREHAEYLALKEIRQIYDKAPKWLIERVETQRRHD
jgi:hypothetical protein